MQDLNGMNMETEYDLDWSAQQSQDESLERREVQEAFEHLNCVINAVEREFSMEMTTTREKLRFLESFINRK